MNSALMNLTAPMYILDEAKLRENLSFLSQKASEAGVVLSLALKAFALWKTFPIFREYIAALSTSGLYEARLAKEEFGGESFTFSPAYSADEIEEIARCSTHVSFNSLAQYNLYHEQMKAVNPAVEFSLRINPELSLVETDLYNPCAIGSRLGILSRDLPKRLPQDILGLHCHCLCEDKGEGLRALVERLIERFDPWLEQVEWLNIGGGHLLTHKDYKLDTFLSSIHRLKEHAPHLRIILEPGSAFLWDSGVLVAQVQDVVVNNNIQTAILNVSFTCHTPDCLEMPYMPTVDNAVALPNIECNEELLASQRENVYRLGGNSCLAGDFIGSYQFEHPLHIGETLIFRDMLHYTTVKTTMFNGVRHPSIALLRSYGTLETLRTFNYMDYKNRMD